MLRKSVLKHSVPKREMSDQSKYQKIPDSTLSKLSDETIQKVVHNVKSQRIHFMGLAPFVQAQPKLLWRGVLTTLPKDRKKYLVFRNIEYIISNWAGDGYPSIIYLRAPGITGYLDKQMLPTDRVAALQLSEISVVLDEADVRTYDLKYILRDCVTWDINLTATQLDLFVSIDQQTVNLDLPLPNPMTVNLELRVE